MDIFIPIRPGLFMDETDSVHHFMQHSAQSLTAITNGDILIATLLAHKGITPNDAN